MSTMRALLWTANKFGSTFAEARSTKQVLLILEINLQFAFFVKIILTSCPSLEINDLSKPNKEQMEAYQQQRKLSFGISNLFELSDNLTIQN